MAPIAGPQLPSSGPQLPKVSIGPSFPSTSSNNSIGPTFPQPNSNPSTTTSTTTVAEDSDSDDGYGPSLPPDLLESRKSITNNKIVQGPTMPPNFTSTSTSTSTSSTSTSHYPSPAPRRKETPLSSTYLDDSDDDFGPMPLPAGYKVVENDGVRAFREREERDEEKRKKEKEGKGKLKREEWMLVPPKDVDLMSILSADTTKLKSRTFAQSGQPGSSSTSGKKSTGPNLWTETPQERQERVQDELLGKRGRAEISAAGGGIVEAEGDDVRRKRERDWQLREEVERHNKSARSTSLLDSHSRAKKNDKDSKQPGIWDRDRDMSVGGRLMDDNKRADAVKSAKDLGSKFGSGSYL